MDKSKILLKILKENMVYVLPFLLVLLLFVNFVVPEFFKNIEAFKRMNETNLQYEQVKTQYDMLKAQQEMQNRQKKVIKDGKIVFDAPDMRFSPDASFAPLFELVLTIAQQSGIRIRAIDYNYAPQEDTIFAAKIDGYNVCELDMVAVGSYTELQTFFKSIMKEQYVTNLAEVELTPWEKDKKVLIANTMGEIADMAFSVNGAELTMPTAWAGALCYVLQIYFDFSGYSDMAIGLGKIFGFDFKENFNYPYSASSIQDFWHRWNISVSTWFKEYVYIPLGGNRKGRMRTNINRIIVFFLTGLWHGANLTFVVWGLIHGFFLLMEGNNIIPVKKAKGFLLKGICHIYTMLVVIITFVFFRADTLYDAVNFISKMFSGSLSVGGGAEVIGSFSPYVILIFVLGTVFSVPIIPKIRTMLEKNGKASISVSASALVSLGLLALCIVRLASSTYNPFIYFRF